jgi:two-component sensor histidine kinase/tetratricopeptide (TPR) repeat protein
VDLSGLQAGTRLSGWKLVRELGRGAFGVTWAAEDENGRLAAVKVLGEAPGAELRALTRVHHPAVVAVLAGGNHPYHHIVMEFVPGRPLTHFLRSGAAPEAVALGVASVLADALATIHQAGLSHGDLKPDNVMVESIRESKLKLVDFGLAGTERGGTLAYAAPERLQGLPSSPAADCYALGMLIWEMVHGALPWPQLDRSEALLQRTRQVPEPSRGSPVVRELLAGLLQIEPANRPSAAHVADRLQRHGLPAPPPNLDLLRRRASSVRVLSPMLADSVGAWLAQGGHLALVGGPGSGRTHLVDHLAVESQARGRPVVRLDGSERPWAAVELALHSATLPGGPVELPQHSDPERRAALAAAALVERCPDGFAVLVDDFNDQDSSVHLVTEALAGHSRVASVVAGVQSPAWASDQCLLEPLDLAEVRKLVRSIFGTIRGGQRLAEQLHTLAEGLPGPTVDFLVDSVERGALLWRAQRWHLDPERMAGLLAGGLPRVRGEPELSPDAESVGGALALLQVPVTPDSLAPLVQLPDQRVRLALNELVDKGLVRLEARQASCRSQVAAHSLARRVHDPERLHRRVVETMVRAHEPDLVRLGWHLVGAGDRRRIEARGADVLEAAVRRDGREAARLADELWALCAHPTLVAPRMKALAASGRAPEARSLGEEFLASRVPLPEDVPVLVELACIHVGFGAQDELALRCVQRARAILGNTALPSELVYAEAQIHFRAGRHEDAVHAARPIAASAPPAELIPLDRWLKLRVVWAQALHEQGERDQALVALESLPDDLGRGRAARALLDGALGRLLWHAGRLRDAVEAMERAAHEDAGLGALDRARMLNNSAGGRHMLGDRPAALAGWEQALILFERLDVPLEQVRVQSNLCVAYREAARWERAIEAGLWACGRARELDEPRYEAMAAGNLGDVFLAQGSWREAQRWYRRAEALANEHGYEDEQAELARRRAELAVLRRDPRATALSERAHALAAKLENPVEAARCAALLAFCHARASRHEALDQAVHDAVEPLRVAGAGAELAEARLWIAEAYLLVGRGDEALAEATRALVFADEVGQLELRRRADALVDRVRSIQGTSVRADRLERLLELAVAVAQERDLNRLFESIAWAARDLLDGERAFVLVCAEVGEPALVASAFAEGVSGGEPSRSIVRRAIEDGREVLAADLGERGELRDAESIQNLGLSSAMCVPMLEGERRLGAIYVDSRLVSRQELESAARLLRALAAYGAVAATNAEHLREVAQRHDKAAEIAHDLRSPASAIHLVVSGLLKDKAESDLERDPLLRVLEAAQRIRSMASGILEEARTEERPVDLANLVDRVVGLLRHVAAQRAVRLELAITPNLWVEGDPQELSRLVTNLVSNALKYAPRDSRVGVSLAADGQEVVGMVRDQGPGIPPGMEEAIFGRGKQAPGAATGHGLGLYICQRIVTEHGGSIHARNHRRGGAMITFRLPRRVRAWESLPVEESLD